jgi:hypothetical protein
MPQYKVNISKMIMYHDTIIVRAMTPAHARIKAEAHLEKVVRDNDESEEPLEPKEWVQVYCTEQIGA